MDIKAEKMAKAFTRDWVNVFVTTVTTTINEGVQLKSKLLNNLSKLPKAI